MTKLLITNLPRDFDSGDLEDLFTTVGDVRSAVVDAVLGAGRVEMLTEESARDAIQRFNGEMKSGHRLIVREDRPHVAQVRPKKSVARNLAVKAGLFAPRTKNLKAKRKTYL